MQNHLEATRSIWTLKLPLCSEPVCHSHQFSRPGLTSPILDSRSSLLDSRFSILNSPFSILNSRSSILDPRFPLLDSRSSIFEPRFTVLDRHGGPSGSYTCKISWDFVRILENTALLPVMYGCTDVQVPPPFHTFYSHALGSVGMCCPSPYWWILLEPPGTPRILLDVPHHQYLKCMAALVCRSPPPFIHFIPMLWAVLACVAILPTTGNYWNHRP